MCSWQLFIISGDLTFNQNDILIPYAMCKLLTLSYAIELCFTKAHKEIYLHHILVAFLQVTTLLGGWINKDPTLYRFGTWLLLLASVVSLFICFRHAF